MTQIRPEGWYMPEAPLLAALMLFSDWLVFVIEVRAPRRFGSSRNDHKEQQRGLQSLSGKECSLCF